MPDVQSFHHDGPKNMNGLWWKIKKIIGGKINSEPPPISTATLRDGGGKIKKNIRSPVVLYTGSFKPNHATDLLHEMVDFKKTNRTSQPCW